MGRECYGPSLLWAEMSRNRYFAVYLKTIKWHPEELNNKQEDHSGPVSLP